MKRLIDPAKLRIEVGKSFSLQKYKTDQKLLYRSEGDYDKHLEAFRKEINRLQEVLLAADRFALLVIFQGMDTAGKDGAIKHVLSGISPSACQVSSFKQPSQEELDHDFLWRCAKRLPERGSIGIFNRSYYEEVLITRVHPHLLDAQKLPKELKVGSKDFWKARYQDINAFEKHLFRSGTRVIKFFLHISKEEQAKRLLARCENPNKQWKTNLADFEERKYWNEYMHAYDKCIKHTASEHAPWNIIPSDDKKNARLMISQILVEELKAIGLKYPKISSSDAALLRRAVAKLKSSRN